MDEIKLLDVVALLEDLPGENLRRGQVGTVVECFDAQAESREAFLVEFSDRAGHAFAFAELHPSQIVRLRYDTEREAA